MTTSRLPTKRLSAGNRSGPPQERSALQKRPEAGTYSRLADVITAAEISHLITGKSCEDITSGEWNQIVRFVSGRRLDQLVPQLQRLLLDCLCPGQQIGDRELDVLWTSVLSVEPESRIDLLREIRILESILAHEALSISRKLTVVRTDSSASMPGTTDATGGQKHNTFVVPNYIVTRNHHYVFADSADPLKQIGAGEHSAVFRARRQSDGVTVAVKLIHPRSPPLSFFREYLTHRRFAGDRNVIQAYEAGRYTAARGDEREVFFFMVLEHGDMTLARLVEDRQSYTEDEEILKQPFLPDEKRFFSRSLLSIVKSLHRHRIIHCDIKPENIYLTVKGDSIAGVKISDFGIARQLPEGLDKVILGRFEGTPAFSPSASIEKGEYSFYTDLFGYARTIACLEPGLYMTGIGQTTQRLLKHAIEDTPGIRRLRGTTTRQKPNTTLGMTLRHMEKNLSSALFRLADSGDPFVLFVILPILDPDRYPFSPRVHEDVAPLARAAYRVQAALDAVSGGKTADALAILKDLTSSCGNEPWYRIMASDVAGLIRLCERDSAK